jgi:hypothetical protein
VGDHERRGVLARVPAILVALFGQRYIVKRLGGL